MNFIAAESMQQTPTSQLTKVECDLYREIALVGNFCIVPRRFSEFWQLKYKLCICQSEIAQKVVPVEMFNNLPVEYRLEEFTDDLKCLMGRYCDYQ